MVWGFPRRPKPNTPEQLIAAVIEDIEHKLIEARLQMLAADVARKQVADPAALDDDSYQQTRKGLEKLETTLRELESRRNMLIARARDADARLAIERALMEVGTEPGQVALDLIAERVSESTAEADATAEVRQINEEVQGKPDA